MRGPRLGRRRHPPHRRHPHHPWRHPPPRLHPPRLHPRHRLHPRAAAAAVPGLRHRPHPLRRTPHPGHGPPLVTGWGEPPTPVAGVWLWPGRPPVRGALPWEYLVTRDSNHIPTPDTVYGIITGYRDAHHA